MWRLSSTATLRHGYTLQHLQQTCIEDQGMVWFPPLGDARRLWKFGCSFLHVGPWYKKTSLMETGQCDAFLRDKKILPNSIHILEEYLIGLELMSLWVLVPSMLSLGELEATVSRFFGFPVSRISRFSGFPVSQPELKGRT